MKFLLFICITLAINGSYIPYQAHGFNDLPYMLQLIKKGVTYFKMDVAPATKDSCLLYSNWKASDNKCYQFISGFEICCLAFRGDTASIPVYEQQFSLTTEFLQLIKNNEKYFVRDAEDFYKATKVFAFDFQYDDKFDLLTRQFLSDLADITKNYNVEILLGYNSKVQDYVEKCKNVKCDDIERKIAEAKFYKQTSSLVRKDDEETNFNTFYGNIEEVCEKGWPEWVGKFSAIFWEPSHEYQVKKIREKFDDPDCKISQQQRKIENLRIASNVEPEQLQIFWKKYTESQTFDYTDYKKVQLGQYFKPKILYHKNFQNYFLIYQNADNIIIQQLTKSHLIISQQFIENQNLVSAKNVDDLLVIQTLEKVIFYTVKAAQIIFENELEIKHYQLIGLTDVSYTIVTIQDNDLIIDFYTLDTYQSIGQVILENQIEAFQALKSIKFDIINSESNEFYFVFSYTLKQKMLQTIHFILGQIDSNLNLIRLTHSNSLSDFGLTSDLKLIESDNKIFVAELHQNGICQAAILLNNNDWNKCEMHKYEDQKGLINVKYVLNYIYGAFEDLFDRVEKQVIINGCDTDIMYAKLGNGNNPSFVVNENEMFIVTELVNYSQLPTLTTLFCGRTYEIENNHQEQQGLLHFSFELLDPKLF